MEILHVNCSVLSVTFVGYKPRLFEEGWLKQQLEQHIVARVV